jgi:hypothetical protein
MSWMYGIHQNDSISQSMVKSSISNHWMVLNRLNRLNHSFIHSAPFKAPYFTHFSPRDDPLWPENPERCARHASAAPGSTGMGWPAGERNLLRPWVTGLPILMLGSETTNSWRYQHFKPFAFDRLVQLHAKRSLDDLQNTRFLYA